ncbi:MULTISPECIES: acid phosphatase [Pantoea]|uniref:Phosphoesterase PA-phosphatase n=2 Tax=Pantoea TaxID=53335 RepID=A0A0U3TBS6_9GAMM|nr:MULTISPECIES: phosphatase PAP2 family protein [Pantoea]ALV92245.1 phosphoesterase PA-phosphatase [Pantoea vagans]KHJ65668.1 phosphoesterase PA-phosphatase [Pantoea rodasii]
MKTRYTLIATVLLLAQQAHATTLPQVAALAAQTSTGATPGYTQLEQQSLQAERKYLQGDSATLKRDLLEKAKQTSTQADKAWLKSSGYDFNAKQNQQAGIALLSGFSTLPASVLDASRATVTSINLNATQNVRHQALQDAEAISSLYFLSDAMGPRLGKAFLAAYDKGEIGKAAALIKASEVSTSAAKKHFNYPRPFLHEGNTIHLVPDDVVVKDNVRYTADGGSFPSGHTNTGYTDALLMAEMVPERFEALVTRGARYGYSRLVLGVHYPLDVMGSRMVAERNVATYLNDARYQVLFKEARDQLRTALEKECGTSLAECARTAGKDDPYRSPDMKTFYRFTMSYNLPKADVKNTPVQVPQGAEILLKTAMPHLSDAQIRNLMVKTALPNGYPLSGNTEQSFWQRVDLTAAYAMAK